MTDPLPNAMCAPRSWSKPCPHMQRYDEQVVVIKYGGHAMGDQAAAEDFAEDVVLLEQSGLKPIVVHGGGPQIGRMLNRLGIRSEFQAGLRVTDEATVEVVEMVLAGSINKQIVGWIGAEGGKAVGPVRQGRQHGDGPQGHAHRGGPRFAHRAGDRSRLRGRARACRTAPFSTRCSRPS
jgi:acetylglutamate kinase